MTVDAPVQVPVPVLIRAAQLARAKADNDLNEHIRPWVSPSPLHAGIFLCCVADLTVRLAAYSGDGIALGAMRADGTQAPLDEAPVGLRVAIAVINHVASAETEEALAAFMSAVIDPSAPHHWPSQALAFGLTTLADVVCGHSDDPDGPRVVRM